MSDDLTQLSPEALEAFYRLREASNAQEGAKVAASNAATPAGRLEAAKAQPGESGWSAMKRHIEQKDPLPMLGDAADFLGHAGKNVALGLLLARFPMLAAAFPAYGAVHGALTDEKGPVEGAAKGVYDATLGGLAHSVQGAIHGDPAALGDVTGIVATPALAGGKSSPIGRLSGNIAENRSVASGLGAVSAAVPAIGLGMPHAFLAAMMGRSLLKDPVMAAARGVEHATERVPSYGDILAWARGSRGPNGQGGGGASGPPSPSAGAASASAGPSPTPGGLTQLELSWLKKQGYTPEVIAQMDAGAKAAAEGHPLSTTRRRAPVSKESPTGKLEPPGPVVGDTINLIDALKASLEAKKP